MGIEGDHVIVESGRLEWDGERLTIGAPTVESALPPTGMTGELTPGVLVALHWDYICSRLSIDQYVRLQAIQDQHLALANREPAGLAHRIES